jgi:SAM-dependent methyltransferase
LRENLSQRPALSVKALSGAYCVDYSEWTEVKHCPACGGDGREIGRLFLQQFYFDRIRVQSPAEPVRLFRCRSCELIYKNLVPSPDFLTDLTRRAQDELWPESYDYADEFALIRRFCTGSDLDMLDVGAAGGELLKRAPGSGRRSALDLLPFSRLQLRGEFIQGFVESPELRWSGVAYDVVTVFDVFEHLYRPRQAMENLRAFVRQNGVVLIETGDADSLPERLLPRWS